MSGFPEQSGGSAGGFESSFSSTNAVGSITIGVATTGSTGHNSAPAIVIPSSATALYIIPTRSTNPSTAGLRLTQSTATAGVYIGYRGPSLINVETTAETTFHIYTTGQSTVAFRAIVL